MATARLGAALRQIHTLFDGSGAVAGLTDAQLLDRFVSRRDEAAFAALVERHGTMVMAACRGVLREPNDAEDAFQATFLILVRKAGSIWVGDSLACWLYKVARRVAVQANIDAARRREVERRAGAMDGTIARVGRGGEEDDRRALHEEIRRLPERYRAPILLCDLEELTRNEAAGQLGWTPGTVASRLARGRALLRDRLARRGFASAAGPAALFAACRAEAAVSESLLATTIKAATALAAGGASATAVALSDTVLRSTARIKVTSAALIAVAGLLGAGAVLLSSDGPDSGPRKGAMLTPPEPPKRRDAPALAPAAEPAGTVPVSGRVVDTDGKPIAGARIDVIARKRRRAGDIGTFQRFALLGSTKTDADGKFGLDVRRTSSSWVEVLQVMAVATGRGMDGEGDFDFDAHRLDAAITMGPERPIRGRLIDLEGRPVAGVKLRTTLVAGLFGYGLEHVDVPWDGWPKSLVTDAEGRFTIPGMGRMSDVTVEPDGDRFARQEFRFGQSDEGRTSEKTFVLSPERTIEVGVAYDDGRPAAEARVTAWGMLKGMPSKTSEAVADGQGRARVALWPGETYRVTAYPPSGEPYLSHETDVDWPSGTTRQTKEFTLKRGVTVRGRVVEEPSGRPVAGARLEYLQVHRNNSLWIGYGAEAASGPDGRFVMVVPRGPGDILVGAATPAYLHVPTSHSALGSGRQPSFEMYPDALGHLDIKPDTKEHDITLTLRRGVTISCRIVDPGGKSVAQAIAFGRSYVPYSENSFHFVGFNGNPPTLRVRDGMLEVPGLDPGTPSTLYILDPEHQLGATAELSGKSAADGPATIRLAPCGSAKVRFKDKQGKPISGRGRFDLSLIVTPGADFIDTNVSAGKALADLVYHANLDRGRTEEIKSDADGSLTYVSLIPGARYKICGQEFTAEAGKTTALPDAIVSGRGDD